MPTSTVSSSQDRRFTDSDPPEARCQATTTRGRACAFVSIAGTRYCTVHADYDTARPPRRSGFGADAGGGSNAPTTSPWEGDGDGGGGQATSSSASRSEHGQIAAATHTPPGGNTCLPLNSLPSIQWPKKIVEIAIGPFAGKRGEVMKFGNGWVTVKVEGGSGDKPILNNRRSMELYLAPEDGQEGAGFSE